MTGTHRMPTGGHRPGSADPQPRTAAVPARSWVWQRPSTGRHRVVSPRSVAGLAWPGETTQRLWARRPGAGS